jgi:hypothetical protein
MDSMEDWSDFSTLIGATAATLIGLIFVVVSLGADHAKAGDEHRARVGVIATLLLILPCCSFPPSAPSSLALLAVQVGYLLNLALVASKRIKAEERDTMWFGVLPMAVYAGFLVTGAAWRLPRISRRSLAVSPVSCCSSRRCTTAGK